jgi:ADP-ribose pyrophosphatase YjhB (NUDIX family)
MPHIHEKVDFTVEVFIVYKDRVLLRKHDKYKIWLSIGGHIELDEDPNQAAVREVKEEVGLDLKLFGTAPSFGDQGMEYKELIPPVSVNRHRINPTHEHVTYVYFAKANTEKIDAAAEGVEQECKWFSIQDLDSGSYDIRDSIKHYAKMAIKTVKGAP